jgi:hypothetical protein
VADFTLSGTLYIQLSTTKANAKHNRTEPNTQLLINYTGLAIFRKGKSLRQHFYTNEIDIPRSVVNVKLTVAQLIILAFQGA